MDFELRRAREKLEREQKERKERARLKLQREKKSKEEAALQRDAIEAVQRTRRIEAAQAQLKADLEMEENLLAGRGIMFYRVLKAFAYQGSGDKIKLPPSCFTELSEQGAFDKGPLHFRLSVIGHDTNSDDNHGTTHAGVLEFTAEEGSVGLPPHVWGNLFASNDPLSTLIEVRYVWLPKGIYAKLKSDEFGFSDIPNHKAVLETILRQHATLSQNDVLMVSYVALTYHLHVLVLKPSSSVSVLETDIEVDIEGPDSASESTNQHILKPLKFGTSESGIVEEGSYMYYKFSIDEDNWKIISSGNAKIEVKLDSDTLDSDTDLYIARHPLLFPTQHQHGWSSHDVGSKLLILSSKDQNLSSGTYSIGVYGFKGITKYVLTVSVKDNHEQKGQQAAASSSSSMEVDSVECKNCKRYIPARTVRLHEAYCSRHNVVCQHAGCGVVLRVEDAKNHIHCEKCSLAFQQGEIEKHIKVFHEPLYCPCGVVLEKEQMVQHQTSECPLRLVTCRFCGDMVQAGANATDVRDRLRGLSEHESLCGSRTTPCDSCGRSVMLKEMDIHQIAVHQKN